MKNPEYIVKIKFLMNMFDGMVINPSDGSVITGGVIQFKQVLNNMKLSGQIDSEMEIIVKSIFGVVNTDVFKPSVQRSKVTTLINGMNYIEKLYNMGYSDKQIKENLEAIKESKVISESVKDLLFLIYFGENTPSNIEVPVNMKKVDTFSGEEITRIKVGYNRVITIPPAAMRFKGKGFKNRDELKKLSLGELKVLLAFYRTLASSYGAKADYVVCPYFEDIAHAEFREQNTDPCSGGFRAIRHPISCKESVPPGAKIVYKYDNSDACGPELYLSLIKYLEYNINTLINIYDSKANRGYSF